MTMKLVLVGGGHAHLSVLQMLARHRQTGADVVLITPCEYQNYSGMLPGWMAGHYRQAQCQVDLRPLVRAAGARLLLDPMVTMDAERQTVTLACGQRIEYDYLSLDAGSETDTSWLGALGAKLLPIKPLDKFFAAWPQIVTQAQAQPGYRLVVVGGGGAGLEIALAAQYAFNRAAVDGQVDLVTGDTGLLPGHGAGVQRRLHQVATRAGLGLHFLRAAGTSEGVLLSDGRLLRADRVIAATGARTPVWTMRSGLALDEGGYVLVNQGHQSVSHPNVFAGGDLCARQDVTMARSGVHAVHAGPVLGHNLLAAMNTRPLKSYRPKSRSLVLLACGPRYAVASWGIWSAQGGWVWRWKDWIDRSFIRRFSEAASRHQTQLLQGTP